MADAVNGRERKTLHLEIPFTFHVWKTPVSREALPQDITVTKRGGIVIPVWIFVAARKLLGESLYERLKSAARRGK